MSQTPPCPYCGVRPSQAHGRDGDAERAERLLAAELRRIREIAETRQVRADKQRIDELSREVRQLRETIARLRGSAASANGYR
jgi:hypothetical protein